MFTISYINRIRWVFFFAQFLYYYYKNLMSLLYKKINIMTRGSCKKEALQQNR